MLAVTELTCEYRKNPLGLDVSIPRISWKLVSNQKNTKQIKYQVQVARDHFFGEIEWDTGEVHSDKSVHIPYAGPMLLPRTRYYYRVRTTDNHNRVSEWSKPAFWETGMMSLDQWRAQWITSSLPEEVELEASPLMRTEFSATKPIATARIYVTALGLYTLYLNGSRVGKDYFTPGWTSYNKRLQYQTYDVTDLLQQGDNAIGAMLGNGWYAGYIAWERGKGYYGDRRALLLQMHICYKDGTEDVIVSNEMWKCTAGPISMAEIYHGETYDAGKVKCGWDTPCYDDRDWVNVSVYDHSIDMLVAQECAAPQIMDELPVVDMFRTPAGETVLDFGQNMVGFVRFYVKGKPGDVVLIRHAEVLDKDGNFYTANLKGAKQTIRYTLRGEDTEVYQPHFTFQGFRYICVDEYPGEIRPEYFTGCVVHTGMAQTGEFTCSNEMVNQLNHNILWGQKGNFLDVPTDCPQRDERHGWTGDAQMFIRTACFHMDTMLFYQKWLRDLEADQTDEFGVTNVVPNVRDVSYAGSAAWGDAAVICPWTLYLIYGDTRVLEEQYDSMKRWVDYIQRQGDDPLLWNTGDHFGDWLALDNGDGAWIGRTPVPLIATAFYANSARLLAETAGVLGRNEDEINYRELFNAVRNRFQQEFVTEEGKLIADTQTAYVLALMFDLLEERTRKTATDTLALLLAQNNYHLNTGFAGTPYLCHVLSNNGYNNLAYRLLLHTDYPSWLYPITKGATTVWEHWDGIKEDGSFWDVIMNSFNHYSYGSIGDWLYRVVAGLNVDPSKPGYKHILIQPRPAEGLSSAEIRYESLYGTIVTGWNKEGGNMHMHVTIPANTTATVIMPGAKQREVLENPMCLELRSAAQLLKQTPEGLQVDIGSGEYVFTYQFLES